MGLLIALAGLVTNVESGAADAQTERSYQVEVIVFKRLNAPNEQPTSTPKRQPFPEHLFAVSPHEPYQTQPMLIEQAVYLGINDGRSSLSTDVALSPSIAPAPITTFKFARFAEGPKYRALVAAHMQQRLQARKRDDQAPVDEMLANPQTLAIQAILSQETFAFRAVADGEKNLDGAVRSIRRSKDYRLLLHKSWTQPINAQTTAILLQGGDQFGDQFELEGTLSLRRSRFLHIETDLWLTRFEATGSSHDPWQGHPLAEQYPALILAAQRGQNHEPGYRYHMAQQRKLRSNEVHYLDHPQFGIILEIRPAEAARAL